MIDSGTTYTMFPSTIYKNILTNFNSACMCRIADTKDEDESCYRCGGNYHDSTNRCYKYNEELFPTLKDFYLTFPTFNLEFEGGKIYEWLPSEYLVKEENLYCIGIDKGYFL